MPSLRRTASSPAVRPSPYATTPLSVRGNGHRRSSGSDTTTRRVLADIEWWRVTGGQCDSSSDQETEDRGRGTQDFVDLDEILGLGVPRTHVEAGVDHPVFSPLLQTTKDDLDSTETSLFEPPTEQFATLAITPRTPTRGFHGIGSTSSSLESTPEPVTPPFHFDLEEVGLAEVMLPSVSVPKHSRFSAVVPVMKRSFTFPDCLLLKDDQRDQYADFAISPLSSAPDFLN